MAGRPPDSVVGRSPHFWFDLSGDHEWRGGFVNLQERNELLNRLRLVPQTRLVAAFGELMDQAAKAKVDADDRQGEDKASLGHFADGMETSVEIVLREARVEAPAAAG